MVAIDNKFEGSHVVRHGGYYYLMASSANCCAGPATGYSVFAGRARSPLGPFVDADGISLTASKAGGTIVVTQNGNRWIGTGHHAVATDHAGRDFLVYHALDRNNPWLDQPFGINRRPMLLDRIDWIDGWPRVRAGAGASDTPQRAPVTGSDLGLDSADPAAGGFSGLSRGPADPQAGATGRLRGVASTRADVATGAVRVRLDVRVDRPLQVELGDRRNRVVATVDPQAAALTVTAAGRTGSAAITLPSAGWRTLALEVGPGEAVARLSEDDLNDPLAEVRVRRPGLDVSDAPLRLRSAEALVDNITIRGLAQSLTEPVPDPQTRGLVYRDEFRDALSQDWRWIRRDPDAAVAGGRLTWPVQAADLVDQPGSASNDTAGVVLNDATPRRQLDRRDRAAPRSRGGPGPQLPAGRPDRLRERRRLRPALLGRHLEHPPGRVRSRAGRRPGRPDQLRRGHHRNARPDHLAADRPHPQPRRRASLPGRDQP